METLLVVDDDAEMRRYMVKTLEKGGFSVQAAPAPSAAVNLLQHAHFDAILLDIDMPEMDGVSLTRLLTQNPQLLGHADVPILLVTGRDDPGIMGDSFEAGARFFLQKPFSPRELLNALALVLRKNRT